MNAVCYNTSMWPFRKKKVIPKPGKIVKRVVVGVIVGGAIGSIIGKKMMEKHSGDTKDEDEDENGFTKSDV